MTSLFGQRVRTLLLRCALAKITGKLAPSRIPRTGDKAKGINCYSAEIQSQQGPYFDVQVDRVFNRGLMGRSWSDENGYHSKVTLKYQAIDNINISITHFLGFHSFHYDSPLQFLVEEFFRCPAFEIFREKLRQYYFNSKTPARTTRIELLKKLVNIRIEFDADMNQGFGTHNGLSQLDILSKIHGNRIIVHPEFANTMSNFKLTIESLVESDDVKKESDLYRVRGKALSTIAKYEQEDRRHREQMQHNSWIKWLTIALVVIGCIQGFAVWNAQ